MVVTSLPSENHHATERCCHLGQVLNYRPTACTVQSRLRNLYMLIIVPILICNYYIIIIIISNKNFEIDFLRSLLAVYFSDHKNYR